jgi:hypothetical protein
MTHPATQKGLFTEIILYVEPLRWVSGLVFSCYDFRQDMGLGAFPLRHSFRSTKCIFGTVSTAKPMLLSLILSKKLSCQHPSRLKNPTSGCHISHVSITSVIVAKSSKIVDDISVSLIQQNTQCLLGKARPR